MIRHPGQNRLALPTLVVAISLAASSMVLGQAGGLSLPEDGGPANGTAQAGSAALARDAQTAWLNPAGMMRLSSTQLMFTGMPFLVSMEFNPDPATTASGTAGGDQGRWLPGGALYFAKPINKRIAVGFSAASPAGLGLDPTDDWVGRYFMTKVVMAAINFEPSIGIRLSEQFSVGGGVDIQYALFEQNIAVNLPGPLPDRGVSIDGDSWAVGFSLSALWEPRETTRFGLRYRYEMSHELRAGRTGALLTGRSSPSTGWKAHNWRSRATSWTPGCSPWALTFGRQRK